MAANVFAVLAEAPQLDSLLSASRLAELAHTQWGPVIIRNQDRRILWAPPGYQDYCREVSTQFGTSCHECIVNGKSRDKTRRCRMGFERCEVEIMIGGRVAGSVSSPDFVPPGLLARKLGKRKRRAWKRPRFAHPRDYSTVLDEVAKRIVVAADANRAEKIRRETQQELSIAARRDPISILFDAFRRLFGPIDVCLFVREDTGHLRKIREFAKRPGEMPAAVPEQHGYVGWAVRHDQPYYEPDLANPTRGGPKFCQTSRLEQYRSAWVIPLRIAISDSQPSSMGVLKLCSSERDAFPVHLQGTALALLNFALPRSPAPEYGVHSVFADWREDVARIMQAAVRDRGRALQCKRDLIRSLTKEALKISGAWNTSLRWVNAQGDLRFIACSGGGWTDERKQTIYSISERDSTGAYVLNNRRPAYIEDVRIAPLPYRLVFPETKSVVAFPVILNGEAMGVLGADGDVPGAFPPEVRTKLELLVNEFQAALEALSVIERSLFRSLEGDLLLNEDFARFSLEASRLIRRMFEASICSIYPLGDLRRSAGIDASEFRGGRQLDNSDGTIEHLAARVGTSSAPLRVMIDGIGCLGALVTARENARVAICLIGRESDGEAEAGQFSMEDETFLAQVSDVIRDILSRFFTDRTPPRNQNSADIEQATQLLLADSVYSLGEVMAGRVLAETRASGAHFRLVDSASHDLCLYGAAGLYSRLLPRSRPAGFGFSASAVAHGVAQWAPEVRGAPAWIESEEIFKTTFDVVPSDWVASACAVPLRIDGEIVGALAIEWRDRQGFEPEQRESLEALAGRCSLLFNRVLRATRTAQRLDRQVKIIEELGKLGSEYATTRDLDRLLDGILTMAIEKTSMQVGTIRLKNVETGNLDLRAPRQPVPGQLRELTESKVLSEGLNAVEPLVFRDLDEYGLWIDFVRQATDSTQKEYLGTLKSMVQVPIRLEGAPIGLITLHGTSPDQLDETAVSLLTILASYAAVATEIDATKQQLDDVIPLAEISEVVADFLHVVANHANAVQALVATIRDSDFADDGARETVKNLRRRVIGLVSSCTSIQMATGTSASERLSLRKSAGSVLADFADVFPGVQRRLADGEDQSVLGLRTQIESVIRHIVRNALEATPQGGDVTVSVSAATGMDERVMIIVRDTGSGMDQGLIAKCTRPFFTTKQGRGGSGLGLWISKRILKRLGGDLKIDSKVGLGTTVTITLPTRRQQ